MDEECDDFDFMPDESAVCPKCMGMCSVDCYCGGDLCVCDNYGEMDCPLCNGEGEVSNALYESYLESRRKAHEAFAKVLNGETS